MRRTRRPGLRPRGPQAALRRLPETITRGELARGFRARDLMKKLGEEGLEGSLGAELAGSAQARRRSRWFNQVSVKKHA